MSKTAWITIGLNYTFPDDMSNEEIELKLQNMELPKEYVEDTFNIFGIWNSTTRLWEEI